MTDRGGELLTLADRLPIGELPAGYRDAMRLYVALGVRPGGVLELLLDGAAAGASLCEGEAADAARWIQLHLPAYAHGSPVQTGLFVVYVRRARGRAVLLASMGEDGFQGLSSAGC